MITKDSVRVRGPHRPSGRSLLARGEESEATVPGWDPSAVNCQGCKYPNQVSHAFFILGVQHLYCRRCGHMIDREGREVSPA